MVKDLNRAEQEILGRIMMGEILLLLDEQDFGSPNKDESGYAHPHLGIPASVLLRKFYNKLSPARQQGLDNNAEMILLSKNPKLKNTEVPYGQSKVNEIKAKNGGHIYGQKQAKPTKQVDGKDSSPKQKK